MSQRWSRQHTSTALSLYLSLLNNNNRVGYISFYKQLVMVVMMMVMVVMMMVVVVMMMVVVVVMVVLFIISKLSSLNCRRKTFGSIVMRNNCLISIY